MKLAGAALNQTPLDWENNLRNIKSAIEQAKEEHVDILCLPEMSIPGYGCEDLFLSEWVSVECFERLLEIKEWCEGVIVCVGLPIRLNNTTYNAACVIKNKEILGFTAKQFLANDGVHYEPRWFSSWVPNTIEEFEAFGQTYQIGDIIYEHQGIKFAFEICEDAWRNEHRPAYRHKEKGVQLIINPSASHFAMSKTDVRYRLVVDASRQFECTYLYVNLLGNEAGKMIYDGEILIAQNGYVVLRNQLLSFKSVDFECAEVSFDAPLPPETVDLLPVDENLEFIAAISLALFDYLRKSRSRGFVLSLSGGADSSLVAVAVAEMVRRAVTEIGLEEFARKTNCLTPNEVSDYSQLSGNELRNVVVSKLLVTAYQGTVNSSDDTYRSAEELAKSIGAVFYNWTIDEEVKSYQGKIEHAIGRTLTWEHDDITLQNIQARVRAPGIWMLANLRNSLLLATSNRSEASVGYATMDGDTAGSISPIAGVDKSFIRQWLVWAQLELGYEGLQYVNNLQPSAELRPLENTQTDEEDLMPYPLLNQIERLAFYERLSPQQVFEKLKGTYPDDQLRQFVQRFYTLWSRNQWKRERYAPAFHLDDYNVDPRSWLRFPILSGSFRQELSELGNA
ncbi:NAD(+) synthase [Rufibacter glacialis]|uniref:Glutamine-dependent NAD(+) synthetase n=1 Tax=Rufibacter glacialis TaxID=1259555 RepID=A0A5M8QQR7_9BACT|nr:NAD(+) synthase [Rufibacter glacialis]KAA6437581.1 NAD(+) synthase [Rufibacter glacialis]GGK58146.1 NAD(+) synthase [Rufibacter glacialis]